MAEQLAPARRHPAEVAARDLQGVGVVEAFTPDRAARAQLDRRARDRPAGFHEVERQLLEREVTAQGPIEPGLFGRVGDQVMKRLVGHGSLLDLAGTVGGGFSDGSVVFRSRR